MQSVSSELVGDENMGEVCGPPEQWVPFRGTLAGWSSGLPGASCSSARRSANSCSWGGTHPSTIVCWESSLAWAEKDILDTRKQCALGVWKANGILGYITRWNCLSVWRDVMLPLQTSLVSHSASVLCSSAQERDGAHGESPGKGH